MTASWHERFWTKVNKGGDCWTWAAAKDQHGYGVFRTHRGTTAKAHRVAYELLVGAIPAGLVIDHLCRNPSCVNPAHLEAVTQAVNNFRGNGWSGRHARATECIKGHPFDEMNTYWRPDGKGRECRACGIERRSKRAAA